MRVPPYLAPGSRVALLAPSGPLHEADLEHAIASARSFEWQPVVGAHVLERHGYLAGSDANRAADFNRFAADDEIDGIWCLRGGYGAMRILNDLDYDAWTQRPKTFIGYSDITALHAALSIRSRFVTYHGPTGRSTLTDFSRTSLHAAVVTGTNPCGTATNASTLRGGSARGRLAGGNLALVAALMGTPFEISLDDAILVLEDVNESVYRIDRMLTQLRLAGALDRLAGIAFGHFSDIPDDATNAERSLDDVLQEVADHAKVPCLARIPLGHIDDQWTIPLGTMAEINADARTLVVES
ncbi:MAG TPA: LD-carboxypeptidase [Gemmatimonadaceae bacterium]